MRAPDRSPRRVKRGSCASIASATRSSSWTCSTTSSLAARSPSQAATPSSRRSRALAPAFATVVATQDWHPPGHVSFASSHAGAKPYETIALPHGTQELWPDHCVRATRGAALHPGFPDAALDARAAQGDAASRWTRTARFRENVGPDGRRPTTGLGAWLAARGVRRVFVCGLARDFCVRWTAEDAAAEGFETFVLDDLTRPVSRSAAPRSTPRSRGRACGWCAPRTLERPAA